MAGRWQAKIQMHVFDCSVGLLGPWPMAHGKREGGFLVERTVWWNVVAFVRFFIRMSHGKRINGRGVFTVVPMENAPIDWTPEHTMSKLLTRFFLQQRESTAKIMSA